MGTLKTSINITSADTLPFSVNQTAKGTVLTGEFVESGTKTIQPLTNASFAALQGLLSTREFGANGAYVYAENPATNTSNIALFGHTDVTNAVLAASGNFAAITGLEPLAIITPGDSMLVPVPGTQVGLHAYTTYGTATLQYYLADRQGQFGQSGLVITAGPTAYGYAVLDAQAGTLSGGNPTPYFTSIEIGVSSSYAATVDNITNNKGYTVKFIDDVDNTHKIYKFIDVKGRVVDTLDITDVGEGTYSLEQMGGYVIAYTSASNAIINHFDGESFYTHTISGSFNGLETSGDDCSSDGAFVIKVNDYLGNSGDIAHILVNKDNKYVLSVINTSSDLYVNDVATSLYGSFFFLSIDDDDSGYYTRFQIWSTNGVLLKDLDVTEYNLDTIDYVLYGSNKLQIIANNGNGLDYLLNYNGATNHLIGHNSTNPQLPLLNWSHVSTGAYGTRVFYAYDKYPTDSIRNYNYDWNSGQFDAESMAIVYSNDRNNLEGSYHINSQVSFCDIVYVMAGATNYGVHQFTNDQTKYIRIPGEFGYNRITPSSNLIAFNYSTNNYESGSLQVLAITPTGVVSSSIAPKLEELNYTNGDILATPVGEYILYRMSNNVTDKVTYTMFKSATRKGSVVTSTGGYDLYTRYNSVGIFDYELSRGWYFNTSNNAFVELPRILNWYDGGYEVNRSTTVNGVNDGNILIVPDNINTTAAAKMRLLKSGTVTVEKQLPVTDGSWDLRLGSEAVFLLYQDMADNYKYVLNVYDLNLDLVKTIPLNTDNYNHFRVVGKRCSIQVQNADQLLGPNYYGYYMISLEGMAYWLHGDSDGIVHNDKWYWDFSF